MPPIDFASFCLGALAMSVVFVTLAAVFATAAEIKAAADIWRAVQRQTCGGDGDGA